MRKWAFVFVVFICLFFILACTPERWKHVDIQQINASGEVVQTWEDTKIINVGPGMFCGGNSWVLFETIEGRKVALICPHRFIYR